ncbi:capsid protein [Tortoise genomovirus 17]|uniref:Capsid protein n=1 Tax=Tortoise genomovirus 17 TaxID=2582878 RepID=A0A4P8WAN1_9VIRU|nr:capsid protein [Tortoise genomovirus 17]QCS37579.1 capsid protein [Tortoise genomovirus 17]
MRSRYTRRGGYRRTRKTIRRKSYARRRPLTRSTRRFRSYRPTKKRILNLTSRKKSDTMAVNLAYPASADPAAIGNKILTSANPLQATIWCATARPLREIFTNDRGEVTAGRNARTCFIRGLKFNDTYVTDDGEGWRHRQIIFTNKGDLPLGEENEGDRTISSVTSSDGRETFYRGMADLPLESRTPLFALLFKGNGNPSAGVLDWTDLINAPVDRTRFKVLSDRHVNIRSGNDSGTVLSRKTWVPINKNLVYGDEEVGNQMFSTYKSTTGKPGIGDVYVLDIFTCINVAAGSTMLFNPTTTLYWHEK